MIKKYYVEILSFSVLLAYLSPNLFFWNDAKFLIHDNLDSNIIWYKILAESKKMFASSDAPIPALMNGVPRIALGSQFNINLWLYYFFSAPAAYSVNIVLLHFFAFFGMRELTKNHLFKNIAEKDTVLINGIALTYALLPFWPPGGLSVAGLPFLLNAFLNIEHHKSKASDWIIILLFPLYSDLFFSGAYFLFILLLMFIHAIVKNKIINWKFFFAISAVSAIYILVEYRLFSNAISGDFVHHRTEAAAHAGNEINYGNINFKGVLGTAFLHFINGQYHSQGMQFPIIILGGILALIFTRDKRYRKIIVTLFLLAASISFIYKVMDWTGLNFVKQKINFLRYFNIRFYILFPVIWYCIFGISAAAVCENKKIKYIFYLFILLQAGYCIGGTRTYEENSFKETLLSTSPNEEFASFNEYYQPLFFDKIKTEINEDIKSFNVICVGFIPAIAQYNGFHTLDGYLALYPLEYKKEIRKIIEGELDKNSSNKEYFDGWGNKCYLFLGEKPENGVIHNLAINMDEFKNMNGKYILSAYQIQNSRELNIELVSEIKSGSSTGRLDKIFLYKSI